MNLAALLAHQGGWDELLLVAVPLVVISALLLFANRRVSAKLRDGASDPTDSTSGSEPSGRSQA